MGSFRSQPDNKKHTVTKEGPGFTYAVSSMCGKQTFIQDGDSTWRMLILTRHSPIKNLSFLAYLMGTVVNTAIFRSRSLDLR